MLFAHKSLRSVSQAVLLAMLATCLPASEAAVLPEGTPLRMKINRTLSSSSAQQGENVDFQTLDDIKLNESIVIPKGSTAIGTVTEAAPKGHMGKGGRLNMNIDYVRMPNGDKLALRGIEQLKGGGHGAAMTGGMVATAVVFWPAAPLFLFMHGKDITVPQGHKVTVYTNSDYTVQTSAATAQPASHAAGPALHNADVLKMKDAGFGEELIVSKIKASPGAYELSTDDLLKLKSVGLSDAVISAMLGNSAR